MATPKKRARYVDAARGFAIAIGLFSHVMLTSGAWEALKDASPVLYGLRLITRFATPTFIVLFGVSLTLAYSGRWAKRNGPSLVRGRLLRRAAKCYFSLAIIGAAGLVGGVVSGPEFLAGLAFLAPVFNADIFAFYTAGMLAAMALIPLSRKIGLLATLFVTLAWWPLAGLLTPLAPTDERLAFLVSRLFGIGVTYGPSVFHALPLVVCGMIIGQVVRQSRSGTVTAAAKRDAAIVVGLGSVSVLVLLGLDGPAGMAVNFVSATAYRNTNHFGYFAIGLMAALVILSGAYLLTERLRRGRAWEAGPFGSESLLSFTVGNVVINLLGVRLDTEDPYIGIATTVLLIAAIWGCLRIWLRWRDGRKDRRSLGTQAAVRAPID